MRALVGRDHGAAEEYPFGWGGTVEEALDALAKDVMDSAMAEVQSLDMAKRKAEMRVAEVRAWLAK